MSLEMNNSCQACAAPLAFDSEAYICSFECTFCPLCAGDRMMVCPNCGGELLRRPRRANACNVLEHAQTECPPEQIAFNTGGDHEAVS